MLGFRAYVRKRALELDRLCDRVARDLTEARVDRSDSHAGGSTVEPGEAEPG